MSAAELGAWKGRALREAHYLANCSESYVTLTPGFTGTVYYPANSLRLWRVVIVSGQVVNVTVVPRRPDLYGDLDL